MRIDLELEVGAVTETVEVRAATVAIDTDTSTVGHMVTTRQVTELPLNGRNFLQLLFLGGGAVETTGEQGTMRQGVGNAISINGARPTSNNYLLDGTANTDTALNTPAVVLSVDAIQEFKEQTSTYSAEYGFSANQINIVSKSGTNDFHGSLFWFLGTMRSMPGTISREHNCSTCGRISSGSSPAGLSTFRRFTMAETRHSSWRTTRVRGFAGELTGSANVPTSDMLAGRFPTPVRDPLTGQNFPGNVIPESRFSRLGNLARQKFFPASNLTSPQGNYRDTKTVPRESDQQTYRVDQNLGRLATSGSGYMGRVH